MVEGTIFIFHLNLRENKKYLILNENVVQNIIKIRMYTYVHARMYII